ncbi:MAG: nicotinate-nucleotide adenylyltransferase [Planctomycetota bacterium]
MRLGFLGGTFDPVHEGHLALARACRDGAALDRVVFVVAGTPPHKLDRRLAPAKHRLAMVRLAAEPDPGFVVDDREIRREGIGYTIDTVGEIVREHPDDDCFWIIGADTLPELPTWREAARLIDTIGILSATRPGYDPEPAIAVLDAQFGTVRAKRISDGFLEMPPAAVSSTEIRARLAGGESVAGLGPDRVAAYIAANGLYS